MNKFLVGKSRYCYNNLLFQLQMQRLQGYSQCDKVRRGDGSKQIAGM